ncbi:alpha/beta hydrolase family protein, partial [Paramuribaculum intestinale]|uniref:alpha/beta hydrolase family protein n=1 Tax=Paramuribaculum intestinale TaxID=2094151 RepID=UPI0025B71DC5
AVYVADKNGKIRKLSEQAGTNSATFSRSMKYFLNVYSSATQPPVTTLCSADGKTLSTLIDNAELKAKTDPLLGTKEFFSFKTGEGVSLNGWMVKPRDFDASKKYPVIMYQYSGPGSQQVTDSWDLGFYGGGVFESYMAQQGFIYVCVDGRGTGGRGSDFEKCTYLRLGDLESKDQVETALYLSSLPYVDKDN